MSFLKSHKTFEAGKDLRFALYKEAMKALEKAKYPDPWKGGWLLLRGLGKEILGDYRATDAECAQAIILKHSGGV